MSRKRGHFTAWPGNMMGSTWEIDVQNGEIGFEKNMKLPGFGVPSFSASEQRIL